MSKKKKGLGTDKIVFTPQFKPYGEQISTFLWALYSIFYFKSSKLNAREEG